VIARREEPAAGVHERAEVRQLLVGEPVGRVRGVVGIAIGVLRDMVIRIDAEQPHLVVHLRREVSRIVKTEVRDAPRDSRLALHHLGADDIAAQVREGDLN
jgi:hypothetical protein